MDPIEGLKELMVMRLDGLVREVLETQRLQRETNGRLRNAEGEIANMKPRLHTVEREMGEVRADLADVGAEVRDGLSDIKDQVSTVAATVAGDARVVAAQKTEAGENRRITKWDVWVFCSGVATAYGLGLAFRWFIESMRAAL